MPAEPGRVRLSPMAEVDLEDIWLYSFRRWSANQADRYLRDILSAMDDLAVGRRTGRPVDVRDGYFRYAVGAHLLPAASGDPRRDPGAASADGPEPLPLEGRRVALVHVRIAQTVT